MGKKASDPIVLDGDGELESYLRTNHSVYMDVEGKSYYLTDVNDHYWRVQDTEQLNDKGHYVDVSEPVATVSDFMRTPAIGERSIADYVGVATFYPSVKA
ncbi:CDP-alcohol phosphatidyltransferase [bacterium]|nr:CDP-alcohol phosphatidyltransferase [bacterium]